jgi:hypothetical protein
MGGLDGCAVGGWAVDGLGVRVGWGHWGVCEGVGEGEGGGEGEGVGVGEGVGLTLAPLHLDFLGLKRGAPRAPPSWWSTVT